MATALTRVLLLLSSLYTSSAFPNGPPPSTCLTMFPKHSHSEQQPTDCPFTIALSSATYSPLQEITVTVDNPEGRTFRGFQIRARRVRGDTETVVGSFISYPESIMQAFSCLDGDSNMIAHKTNEDKTNLTLRWKAPASTTGDIVFTATILTTYKEFWADVRSLVLSEVSGSGDEGSLQEISNVDPQINLEETCGKSKGCFFFPRQCMGSDCDAAVSYQTVGNTVQFEMFGKAEGWLSVGFSHDKIMGGDETVSCTAQDSRVTVQRGYNPALHNERQYTVGLTNMSTVQMDGKVYCRFTRPMVMDLVSVMYDTNPPNKVNRSFDLSEDWFMMLGWGYTYHDTDVMGKHDELPAVTQNKVNFKTYVIHRGSVFPVWLQAHACLMIVSWMLLVGLGTILARHYRDGVGGKMLLGHKRWFQFHRTLVVVAACCTAAGFIIIFVKIGDWAEDALTHAYLGIAIMAATTLQVFLGIIRPSVTSSIRPIFNWTHRILGKLTHMAAAAEFYLAFEIPFLPSGMRWLGFVLVITWIAAQVFFELVLEIVRCCLSRKSSTEEYELSNQFKLEEKYPEKSSRMKSVILVLYIITILALTVAGLCAVLLY